MVIFGAGASFDAIPSHPASSEPELAARLPLAQDLFADHLMGWADSFPECEPIIPRLQRLAAGMTVESELERLQNEAEGGHKQRPYQLTALRFYLQRMIYFVESDWSRLGRQITNYKTLLDDILGWRPDELTLLVTFNYDLMLEKALRTFGIAINEIGDYIKHERFKLIKLHGSVDWARQMTAPLIDAGTGDRDHIARQIIEQSPPITGLGYYHRVGGPPPCSVINYTQGGNPAIAAGFPAIAIPVETKKNFDCPNEHLDTFTKLLPKVTKILVIGWRGMEAHFRTLLEHLSGNVQVMVVSPTEADQTIANLQKVSRLALAEFKPVHEGFTEFIINRAGERFLRV